MLFGQNETVELVGPGVPECSNCQQPRAGGVFSDDGDVYLCLRCLSFHDEYRRIMARIDADMKALSDEDSQGSSKKTLKPVDHLYNLRSGAPRNVKSSALRRPIGVIRLS